MDNPKIYKNFIRGEWVEAQNGEVFENRNPATGEVVGIFPRLDHAGGFFHEATVFAEVDPRMRIAQEEIF